MQASTGRKAVLFTHPPNEARQVSLRDVKRPERLLQTLGN